MQKFDLLIVGGGMVGAAVALGMADTGLDICVIERKLPQPFDEKQPPDIRVSAFSAASQQLLEEYGAWPHIMNTRLCAYQKLEVWEQEASRTRFNAADVDKPYLGHIVENRLVQNGLLKALTQHSNVTVLEASIRQLTLEPAIAVLDNGRVLSADLVVAADGAGSAVRQTAGMGISGWQYQQHAMAVCVKTHGPQQNITWQQFTPTGPVAFLPLYDGYGSLVWYHHGDEIQRLKNLPPAGLKEKIQQSFPQELVDFDIISTASFPLTRMHANQYVKSGVVLVGDAAHQINPLAGQGVNLGFKDVRLLVSELKSALEQNIPLNHSSVLERYSRIRRRDNLLMMSAMDGFYHLFSNDMGPLKQLRNLGLRLAQCSPLKNQVMRYAMGL